MAPALTIKTDQPSHLAGATVHVNLEPAGIPADVPAHVEDVPVETFASTGRTFTPGSTIAVDVPEIDHVVAIGVPSINGTPMTAVAGETLGYSAPMPDADATIEAAMTVDGDPVVATPVVVKRDLPAPVVKEFQNFSTPRKSGILPGKVVDGKGVLVWRMTPKTSTHAADVAKITPTTVPNTNPYYLVALGNPSGAYLAGVDIGGGWLLEGTDQGHLYGGMMVSYADQPHIHDGFITAIPGDSGEPPGETFSLNLWRITKALIENVGIDGKGIAASLFGLNNVEGALIRKCVGRGNRDGTALTSWKSGLVVVEDFDASGSLRPFNIEQPTGAHTYTRPNMTGIKRGPHITVNSNERSVKVRIEDPKVDRFPVLVGVKSLKDAYGTSDGKYGFPPKDQLQKASDVELWIGGKNVSADPTKLKVGNVWGLPIK